MDAAGNSSAYSSSATVTTPPDTQAPTAPTALTATAASATRVDLSWTASADDVGVAGYRVERCQGAGCTSFVQVGAPAARTYSDTGLAASTTYVYRVRAADAAGNLGPYSATASATTRAAIAFVQQAYAAPQGTFTTASVKYAKAQVAGDTNVVVVGWDDTTASISSVTDTKGNVYALAVGPTQVPGALTQAIYYAANIWAAAAGANTVTVTFSGGASYPDVRVLEYSGLAAVNPVDVVAVGTGTTSPSSTATITTTYPSDLLFAANTVKTATTGAGTGFTKRVITLPNRNIAEDRIVSAVGAYRASAPISPAGTWIMQMVAFRAKP
jgi:hypothetical protein